MLDFYTSMTVAASDIRKMRALLTDAGELEGAMSHILTTPLYMSDVALAAVRDLRERVGGEVCFDSAGYYVQVGRIKYDELYYKLLCCYRANQWADRYILPDNVPCTQDSPAEVWYKVRQTVEMSILFYQELPPALQWLSVPVVHGHTEEQVEYCLRHYLSMGPIKGLGFGSFSTNGKDNGSNSTSNQSIANVRLIVAAANKHGLGVHLFGLGVPAMVGLIDVLGASSFDSASWLKTAGFGQVHLPFTRSYNVSHRSTRKNFHHAVDWEEFIRLREMTGHQCYFCSDRVRLSEHKMYRAMHNLLVVRESVTAVNSGERERIDDIYNNSSPKYRKDYLSWQQLSRMNLSA